MSITPDNGSKNKRRRYFANGRSRTIELSTLAEIDEEEYSKGVIEGVGPSSTTSSNSEQPTATTTLTTQDDMCIGTLGSFKSLKRGSVKAQALKLSERLAQKVAAENAAKEEEQQQQQQHNQHPLQQHHQQQNQQHHQQQTNQTSVKIRRSRTFDNTEFNASEWQAQQQQQQQQQQQSQQSSTDFISAPPPARHPLSRSASFVTAPTPLIVYSMPAPPPPSAIPPQQQQQQQLSDRLSAALLDSRCESRLIGDYSMPLYYALPPPTPQNAPQPIFLPFIPPNYMDTKQQMFCLPYDIGPPPMMTGPPTTNNIGGMRRKMKSAKRDEATGATSWCSRICCAGLAQLLWTVVCIISFGIIASLILALCYM